MNTSLAYFPLPIVYPYSHLVHASGTRDIGVTEAVLQNPQIDYNREYLLLQPVLQSNRRSTTSLSALDNPFKRQNKTKARYTVRLTYILAPIFKALGFQDSCDPYLTRSVVQNQPIFTFVSPQRRFKPRDKMCFETKITYAECYCTLTINMMCYPHVEHTHKQVNNKPCPYHEVRELVVAGRGCEEGIPNRCLKLDREEYTIESEESGVTAEEQWSRHWENEGRGNQLRDEMVYKLHYYEEEEEDDDGDEDEDDNMDDAEREELVKKQKLERDFKEGEEKRKFEEDVDMDVNVEQKDDSVKKQKLAVKEGSNVNASKGRIQD